MDSLYLTAGYFTTSGLKIEVNFMGGSESIAVLFSLFLFMVK